MRIVEVPVQKDENLGKIIKKLFAFAGYKATREIKFYRLKTGNSKDTIILNFANEYEKERFLELYRPLARKMVASVLIDIDPKDDTMFSSHPTYAKLNIKSSRKR